MRPKFSMPGKVQIMKTVGIICEYNPLHTGHLWQMQKIRAHFGQDCAIVCLMSGNFVQRGAPAIFDKSIRAEAAVRAGADLVLELPIGVSLSSAEGFAAGGVRIAQSLCDCLSFGTESMTKEALWEAAAALNSPEFPDLLRRFLADGSSFPAARQRALEKLVEDSCVPMLPNDILATEYCKAILQEKFQLDIFPVTRKGSYHAQTIDTEAPSATAVRQAMISGGSWQAAVPENVQDLFAPAAIHTISSGEKAMLYRLRTMTDEDFEKLPYGSEGLWRRLMHACREGSDLEQIIALTKTKRYTRTRIDRMILCAYLGITETVLRSPAPYVRILAFSNTGRMILRNKADRLPLLNAGQQADGAYWGLEQRCGDLYGLFSTKPEKPGIERKRRVIYI